jgi:hypothetical protein
MAAEHDEQKSPMAPDERRNDEFEIEETGLDEAAGGQGVHAGCNARLRSRRILMRNRPQARLRQRSARSIGQRANSVEP